MPAASAGNLNRGYNLIALPTSVNSYNFIIDMTNSIGGSGSNGCSIGAPPPIYFTGS